MGLITRLKPSENEMQNSSCTQLPRLAGRQLILLRWL